MAGKISIPRPGTPVRGSRSGAPVMALLDLLGRRWALGVLWVLAERGPLAFNALQAECESISPGVLNTRIKELTLARLIEHDAGCYRLTGHGRALFDHIEPLGRWARSEWSPALADE